VPSFVETYSADMRTALFFGAINLRMGVKGAIAAAQRCELPNLSDDDQATLGAMTYGYACTLVKDERLRRADVVKVRADSGEQAHDLAARLLALVDREVRRLEHTKAKTPVNTGAAIAAAKRHARGRRAVALPAREVFRDLATDASVAPVTRAA
jgi:hypothetical protein